MSFTIGGGVNLEKCYTALLTADINPTDGYLSQSEFLSYLQTSSPDGLLDTNVYGAPLTSFNMLPPEFVGLYNFFACGDALVGCPSVIGIDIRGLQQLQNGEGAELSEQETTFLYRLCKDTEETMEEYEASLVQPPTSAPTNKPTEEPTISEVVETTVPTPSLTIATPPPQSPQSCPPQYNTNQSYSAGDLVSNNKIYASETTIPYFQCKPEPFTAWCSQAAYEPGVTIAWEEAWELMGVCEIDGGGGGTTSTSATVVTTTTDASVATTTSSSTTTSATEAATITTPAATLPTIPTKQPTFTNPEESPTTGPLPVQFQYEIGNNENIQSQAILSESSNDMLRYLTSGTEEFVQLIMDATFGSGGSSSSSSVGAVSKDSLMKTINENVRRGRRRATRTTTTTSSLRTRSRNLAVTYNTTSVSIQTIQDIACSYPNMTTESRCQKVTAGVTLQLIDEPPLMTNLQFQSGIARGIENGLLTFPPESGIVYVGETKAVQVIPELGRGVNGIGAGGGNNNGDNNGTSNNGWVVAVSVIIAVSVAAILILFAGKRFRKRQREGKEFDGGGAVQISLDGDGNNDIENDLSPTFSSGSRSKRRHMTNPFEETIEETPIAKDDDSDLIDLERGGSVDMTMMKDHSNNKQRQQTSKNPFASSSSSGSSSSSSGIYPQHQPVSKGIPLPSWKEVSEEDLSKSGELGEMYIRDHDSTDYRTGVEALVRQACPEHIDSVDDMMAEYEGRETVLIGQLSAMLAAQTNEGGNRNDSFSSENKPRLKAVQESESGVALGTSKSFDESSAAGSSQWSTDDGMSSIDASMSASTTEGDLLPDAYAAIGDAALTISDSNLKTTTFIQVEKNPDDEFSGLEIPGGDEVKSPDQPMSKEDLDAAIEAGDWQAVGATAALLAGNAREGRDAESVDSSIHSDDERGSGVSLSSMDNSDKDRASEFEKLIEAGDWKAVMEIASEFEGAGDGSSNFQFSKLSDMDYEGSGRLSSSEIFEGSDQIMDKRQEIEELVRRVVPDEIENLDEMMMQFQGRENELILTLKTMEERNMNSSHGGSNSSLSSPQSSKEESTDLSHGEIVFEGDSALNESDRYDTDRKSPKSKTSSSNRSSQIDSSSSSEDLTKLIHSEI